MSPIQALANLMRSKMETGSAPHILILGAGASLSSGCSSMWEIVQNITAKFSGEDVTRLSDDEKLELFYRLLDEREDDRYSLLFKHIEPVLPSLGYKRLAELIKWGYFDTVVTTNFDTLLEESLRAFAIELVESTHYTRLIRGRDLETKLESLDSPTPPVKILKLHGDIHHKILFTPTDIVKSFGNIKETITELLKRECIIVGHSMRDLDLISCFIKEGRAIWYVNPTDPNPRDIIWNIMYFRKGSKSISGLEGKFDEFFQRLHSELTPESQERREEIAQGHYGRAIEYFQNGMWEKEEKPVVSTRAEKPLVSDSAKKLSVSNLAESFLNRAILEFEAAITFGKEYVYEYYYRMGKAYEELDSIDKAIYSYWQTINQNEEYTEAYFARGCCHMLLREPKPEDYRQAMIDFQSVLKLDPQYPDADSEFYAAREEYIQSINNYILEYGRITNKIYQEMFNVSLDIAIQELDLLCEENRLTRKGAGRGIYYTLPEEGE